MASCDRPRSVSRRSLIAAAALVPISARSVADAVKRAVRLPEIQLLNGATVAPDAWSGVAAVIVFWSTSCQFCERHNARLEKLHLAARGRRLRVLGATQDSDAECVREHAARHGYSFDISLQGGELRELFGARRGIVPLTVTLDASGQLREVIPGEMWEDDVMNLLRLTP